MKYYSSLVFFNHSKIVKLFLNSQAVQKHVAGQIWPAGHSLQISRVMKLGKEHWCRL